MEPVADKLSRKILEAQPGEPATREELAHASEVMKPELQAIAQQRLETMRQSVARHQTTLQAERGSWKDTFNRAKQWLTKEDSVETHLVKLNIEIDHLLDQIQNASADQVTQHLWKEVGELEKRCAQLVKIEAELAESPEADVETEDQFPVESAGVMKPGWLADSNVSGKLGKFGQDCVRTGDGIGVVADGTSSLTDSYEVARRVSRRAQAILEDIPLDQCDTPIEVEFFVNGGLDGLLHEINSLPANIQGSTTLLASRYLEKFDVVVMIDIGDCEVVAIAGDSVQSLKPPLEHSKRADMVVKSQEKYRKDGMPVQNKFSDGEFDTKGRLLQSKDFGFQTTVKFHRETDRPFVRTASLAELRQRQPGVAIHILLASDGLQNNTGKTLEQQALEIVQLGVEGKVAQVITDNTTSYISETTKEEKTSFSLKDDMTILKMTIPPLAERKQVQIPEEAVA